MNVIGEKDIDVERYVVSFEIDQCLDPAGQDQQEPSQCETGVHVAQQRVRAPYLAVKQRFAADFADRFPCGARGQRPPEHFAFGGCQSDKPGDVFIEQDDQQEAGSYPER